MHNIGENVGPAPAFVMSGVGTPEPLTMTDLGLLMQYLNDLGDAWRTAAPMIRALARLNGDTTPAAAETVRRLATLMFMEFEPDEFTKPTQQDLAEYVDCLIWDHSPIANIMRRLLTHLTAFEARRACGPRRSATRRIARPARRCAWTDGRLARYGNRSLQESLTEPPQSRALRRAEQFGHDLDADPVKRHRVELPRPRPRPLEEPLTAHGPPAPARAIAA